MKSARSAARPPRARANARATRAKKISLTVDERVLRDVENDAKRSGRTLSAHVTDALARDLRRRRLQALLEEYEAERGHITDDELADVRRAWRD
jgi:hypothetical protein